MGKKGPQPKEKVKIEWTPNFAYAVGLIASDGCLSKDGRHISFVSKDKEQVENFLKALNILVPIGITTSGYKQSKTFRVQFGDINFYRFLNNIGLTSAKSFLLPQLQVPSCLFSHFLRGVFDGDGSFYSYFDKRWKSSFMFYFSFVSASKSFIEWLQKEVFQRLSINGHTIKLKGKSWYSLRYAKEDSLKLIKLMYKRDDSLYLSRKKLKIDRVLCIMGKPNS